MSDYLKAIIDLHNSKEETIESLRQRVKELIDINYALKEQARALKAGQGAPVAWMRNDTLGSVVKVQQTYPEDGWTYQPLYTSAPTIPEGWQLAPIEPTPEMIRESIRAWYDCVGEPVNSVWIACYKAMLAAAPKPEDMK